MKYEETQPVTILVVCKDSDTQSVTRILESNRYTESSAEIGGVAGQGGFDCTHVQEYRKGGSLVFCASPEIMGRIGESAQPDVIFYIGTAEQPTATQKPLFIQVATNCQITCAELIAQIEAATKQVEDAFFARMDTARRPTPAKTCYEPPSVTSTCFSLAALAC